MKTIEILIGGVTRIVPHGYVAAEYEYTKTEQDLFQSIKTGRKKEIACDAVVAKRIEFYSNYIAGRTIIPPEQQQRKPSLWRKIQYGLGLR